MKSRQAVEKAAKRKSERLTKLAREVGIKEIIFHPPPPNMSGPGLDIIFNDGVSVKMSVMHDPYDGAWLADKWGKEKSSL